MLPQGSRHVQCISRIKTCGSINMQTIIKGKLLTNCVIYRNISENSFCNTMFLNREINIRTKAPSLIFKTISLLIGITKHGVNINMARMDQTDSKGTPHYLSHSHNIVTTVRLTYLWPCWFRRLHPRLGSSMWCMCLKKIMLPKNESVDVIL